MKRVLLTAFIFCMLAVCGALWAVEEQTAHGKEGATHKETIAQSIGKWLNFFALVSILYLFLKRGLKVDEKFKNNYEEIQRSIESARQAKEEAEKRLKELDERMDRMDEEVARIKESAAKEAEEEKKRILDGAQKEAQRIVEFAHREIDSEVRRARKELRFQVANLAVNQGRKIIEEEMNDQDHKRLLEAYVEDFDK